MKESCLNSGRRNAIVLSWIMNNVAPELLGGVVYASDAYQLHREIATLSQGTNSVSVYFSKLKELWHEYDVLVPFPNCCEKSKEHAENLHQQRVMEFLSGLNESYNQARRQILMKTNSRTLNQAYVMIIQDESQQKISANVVTFDKIEPLAMQAGRGRGRRQYLQCDLCHLKGHTKEKCYKIVGYPADYAPRRRYGEGTRSQSEWQQNPSNGKSGWTNSNAGRQGGNDGNAGRPGGWRREPMANVNNADVSSFCMQDVSDGPSGVAEHKGYHYFTNDQSRNKCMNRSRNKSGAELLSDVKSTKKTDKDRVHLPTVEQADITHIGSAILLDKREIKDVLFVRNFKFNLLSVAKLTKELKCNANFFPDFCMFQDLWNGKVKGIGKERGGLYVLRGLANRTNALNAVSRTSRDSNEVWHNRLGHPSTLVMRHVVGLNNKNNAMSHENGLICPLAKQTRLKFPLSKSRSAVAFHLLKSEAIVAIRQFIAMVQNQFGIVIKVIRSDNGSEFFNAQCSELLTGLGIIHQSSCPYTPRQNGIVKRRHRYILDTARALKFQGSIPTRYWGMCVKIAVYLINMLPSSVLGGKTPYELLYHKNANIAHLRTIGCLCYATNLVKTDKFAERAKAAILMGYSETQKGYILLDLDTKQFFTSRDVIFKESEFPFSKKDENISHDSQEHMDQGALQISPLHIQSGVNTHNITIAGEMSLQDNGRSELHGNLPILQETGRDDMHEVSQNIHSMDVAHADTHSVEHHEGAETLVNRQEDVDEGISRPNRRYAKQVKEPIWMKYYVTTKKTTNCSYPISNYLTYDHTSTSYKCYLAKLSQLTEPQTFKEAVKDIRWIEL
ncbi:PREDICTED: uncharacterized protein LOC109238487 [Nicotiana attenuata]|uniref:uncharacterized protein LOC109238487 n=1 Tax=Nicotiana attenuata TaxID=49451 RepID=UPI0009046B1A|nr:PREDICTED: uncharacterized protein LOC109238487 [Nicotiana attenuata]